MLNLNLLVKTFWSTCLLAAWAAPTQSGPPVLVPVQKAAMPAFVQGRFDHLGIDMQNNRLFAAAESAHQVLVFDLKTGTYLSSIKDIQIPHAIFVRQDLNRLYVTDGGMGAVLIYDGKTYQQLGVVPLKVDADSIGYDPNTHYLYVDNGGGDAHETFSMVSVVDTTTGSKIADIKIEGDTLEAMALAKSSNRIFVNDASTNEVVVIDRENRKLVARWPVTMGKRNVAMALDEEHHRLFVGCRDGKLVVLDTESGKELQALTIGGGVDDASFDSANGRVYAQCGKDGATWIYREQDADHYKLLQQVSEGTNAKNSLLEPALSRYFVIVPPGTDHGSIDIFRTDSE